MGNFLFGNEEEEERTRPFRSWADLTARTALNSQIHFAQLNERQEREIIQQKAVLKKPTRVKKLISLDASTVTLNENLQICFRFDSHAGTKVKIEISIPSENLKFTNFIDAAENSLNRSFTSDPLEAALLDRLVDKCERGGIFINLVAEGADMVKKEDENLAENESSQVKVVKNGSTFSLLLVKQTIVFDSVEYLYKKWYGERDERQGNLCVICLEHDVSTVISPCLHKCLCTSCAKVLAEQRNPCPLCRSTVAEFLIIGSASNSTSA